MSVAGDLSSDWSALFPLKRIDLGGTEISGAAEAGVAPVPAAGRDPVAPAQSLPGGDLVQALRGPDRDQLEVDRVLADHEPAADLVASRRGQPAGVVAPASAGVAL